MSGVVNWKDLLIGGIFGGPGPSFYKSASKGTKPYPFPEDEDIRSQVNQRVEREANRMGFRATLLTPPTGPGEPILGKTTLLGI